MSYVTHKANVDGMVRALRAGGVTVKGDDAGYYAQLTKRSTGEKVDIFRALRMHGNTYLVRHDDQLFL